MSRVEKEEEIGRKHAGVFCTICGTAILATTAKRTSGICVACYCQNEEKKKADVAHRRAECLSSIHQTNSGKYDSVLVASAATLWEARDALDAAIPQGTYLVSEEITGGFPVELTKEATTHDAAIEYLRQGIPDDTRFSTIKVVQKAESRTFEMMGWSKQSLVNQARESLDGDNVHAVVIGIKYLGRRGFLGLGRKPPTYEVTVFRPAIARAEYCATHFSLQGTLCYFSTPTSNQRYRLTELLSLLKSHSTVLSDKSEAEIWQAPFLSELSRSMSQRSFVELLLSALAEAPDDQREPNAVFGEALNRILEHSGGRSTSVSEGTSFGPSKYTTSLRVSRSSIDLCVTSHYDRAVAGDNLEITKLSSMRFCIVSDHDIQHW